MSYILDALRRAEAQRSRGSLPQLHAASSAGGVPHGAPPVGRVGGWAWAVVGLTLLVAALGLLAWWGWARPAAPAVTGASAAQGAPLLPPAPAPSAAGPVAQPVAVPAPMPAPMPMPPLQPPTAPQLSPPAAPSLPPPARAAQGLPVPVRVPLTEPSSARTSPVPGTAAPRPAPGAAPGATPLPVARPASAALPAPAASAPPSPLASRRELPAELQRELPPLAFGGTVYSPDASQRMVLVNGEVWREGDRLAPGLVVTEVRPKDAVLSYKGQRFILAP